VQLGNRDHLECKEPKEIQETLDVKVDLVQMVLQEHQVAVDLRDLVD
jgi:hypothetical protein